MVNIEKMIFDLDGTLIDSKEVIINAVNHALPKIGLKKRSGEEILNFVGTGTRELIANISGLQQEEKIDKGTKLFKDYWTENFSRESTLFPHVIDVLEHYSGKEKLILSNGNLEIIRKILDSFGIRKFFVQLISGDDEDCLKPSTCPVEKAIDIKDGGQRDKTLLVGDMDVDIKAGRSAGIKTCAVTYGMGTIEKIKKADPDFIIDDISEMMDIFE